MGIGQNDGKTWKAQEPAWTEEDDPRGGFYQYWLVSIHMQKQTAVWNWNSVILTNSRSRLLFSLAACKHFLTHNTHCNYGHCIMQLLYWLPSWLQGSPGHLAISSCLNMHVSFGMMCEYGEFNLKTFLYFMCSGTINYIDFLNMMLGKKNSILRMWVISILYHS